MYTNSMITGDLKYLRLPITTNIKPGMQVLVITDTAHDPRVWQVVMSTITEMGAEPTLAMFDPRPADYFDPPQAVCEAMKKSDVNILLASTGMLHAPSNFEAMRAGVPVICMDGGMTLEMFQSGAVTEDQRQMAVRQHYVATNIMGEDPDICRVTSKYGTDLTYSVKNRIYVPKLPGDDFVPYQIVTMTRNKAFPRPRFLYPNGELNIPPVEGSANGKLVIELTMHQFGRLKSPIELTIKDSRIVAIEGGAEAWTLRNYIDKFGDENARYCPAEASIGINSKAMVRGVQREDKNILGSIHFGVGTNIDVGGTVHSNIHMDGVVLEPTLYVDGDMRIEHGRFLRPVEGPM
jgi:leucyl aminopeptidase (aminopeptidase T)